MSKAQLVGLKIIFIFDEVTLKTTLMLSKPNIISTLITAIWAYLGGYLLWDVFGGPLFQDHRGTAMNVDKAEPDMLLLLLGCVITAFAFSTLYGKTSSSNYGLSSGIKFGLLLSLLGISYAIISYSMTNLLDSYGAMYDAVINVIYYVLMGAIAGMVYRSFQSSEAAE